MPAIEGMLLVPLLSKTQILKLKPLDLNNIDYEKEYTHMTSGELTNLDYVAPVCFNNQTFLMKLDLAKSVPYVAGHDLSPTIATKYQSTYSLTHGNISLA